MNITQTIRKVLREESKLPIPIRRRLSLIDNLFEKFIKNIDFNEYDDVDDFHNAVVHEITDELCDDLQTYNYYYGYLDDLLGNKILKVWKNRNKKNIQETIRKVLSEHNKGEDKKVREIILNATEWDDFLRALSVKYGETVPLYHATTRETAEIIDREGFKLTYGKNYKSFTPEELMYFQIGHSDYQASNRPVVYRLDVPIDFIAEFADIDMDNVDISDEDLADVGVDMEYWDDMSYEIKDVISYYVWNNMTLDGMELLITDRNGVGDIFKGLTPVKVSELK